MGGGGGGGKKSFIPLRNLPPPSTKAVSKKKKSGGSEFSTQSLCAPLLCLISNSDPFILPEPRARCNRLRYKSILSVSEKGEGRLLTV